MNSSSHQGLSQIVYLRSETQPFLTLVQTYTQYRPTVVSRPTELWFEVKSITGYRLTDNEIDMSKFR